MGSVGEGGKDPREGQRVDAATDIRLRGKFLNEVQNIFITVLKSRRE